MKIANGLLSKATSIEFLKFNEAFDEALEKYSNYSMLIEFLRFRYYDSYDFKLFSQNITKQDKIKNTDVYRRYKKERKEILKRLYGPFLTGNDFDNIKNLNKLTKLEVIEAIINSSDLDNNKFSLLMRKYNESNIYDFYINLHLQHLANNKIKFVKFDFRAETDIEYIIWNYMLLSHEQNNTPFIDILTLGKENWNSEILKYKKNMCDNDEEPNDINDIIKLCLFNKEKYEVIDYKKRLQGAVIGRFAGCMLGAPVENWSIESMEYYAKETGTLFPPTDYWNDVKDKDGLHYKKDKKIGFSKHSMSCVIADDDITYTILNALIMKKYGKNFTSENICDFWLKHLPYACTAEYETMIGIRRGQNYLDIVKNNPFIELIGAAIRADSFGYVYAGDPYNAAIAAYKDACITHQRNGVYGEMVIAASIAYAFVSESPLKALYKAMDYIPNNCRLKKEMLWAFNQSPKDYKEAAKLIQDHFPHMNRVHTINNMCAVIFAFKLGKEDFDAVISNCVAMGYDNDCTGATVGSLFGACYSIDKISEKWYKNFNNVIHTYIRGFETMKIDEYISLIQEIKEND